MMTEPTRNEADPDPFSVAAIYITGASLVVQIVTAAEGIVAQPPTRAVSGNSRIILQNLENTLAELTGSLDRLVRTITQGSSNPDAEFYDAPLRIAARSMQLQVAAHRAYQDGLVGSYTELANSSRWINQMIRDDEQLTARLRDHMPRGLGQTATVLNRAMEQGRPIRQVIREGRQVLQWLADAVKVELSRRNETRPPSEQRS